MTPTEIVNWVADRFVPSSIGGLTSPDLDELRRMLEQAFASVSDRTRARLLTRAMADAPVSEEAMRVARMKRPTSYEEHKLLPTRSQWVSLVDHLLAQIAHIRHDSGAYEDGYRAGWQACLVAVQSVLAKSLQSTANPASATIGAIVELAKLECPS